MKTTSMKEAPAILAPYSRCHRCGSLYRPEFAGLEWPKRCTYEPCRNLEYHHLNNIGVLLQTVTDGSRTGILTPVRGHAPMIGYPASTGGFQELQDHSSEWAGARETWEEVLRQLGIPQPDEDDLRLLCSRSTGPLVVGRRQNLVFSVNPNPIHVSAFEGFVGDHETTAIDFSWGPRVLAFPSHTYALARYFRDHQGMDVPQSHILQPRTGDVVNTNEGPKEVFETHYHQPMLHEDIWCVLFEDRGVPQPIVRRDGGWFTA